MDKCDLAYDQCKGLELISFFKNLLVERCVARWDPAPPPPGVMMCSYTKL